MNKRQMIVAYVAGAIFFFQLLGASYLLRYLGRPLFPYLFFILFRLFLPFFAGAILLIYVLKDKKR